MHVAADFNWFLQGIVVAIAAALGLVILVRKAASKYFVVDSSFGSSANAAAADFPTMNCRKGEIFAEVGDDDATRGSASSCAICGLQTRKQCGGCKMVKYCSAACQKSHWNSGHKNNCMKSNFDNANHKKSNSILAGKRPATDITVKNPKVLKPSNKILFPYEEFVKFFNCDKLDYPPCGLLNCGNSCFANVVLQCLAYTRSLVAYLLVKGHQIDCQRDDWCFLCEFQTHVERAGQSVHPFSPMNILSRLPHIGGNLGYGKQEDAHEFMRFAIDTMQSVCLKEYGGEKVVPPKYQETTLIQHIFGGRLRSQVICTECNNVSNQFENMMDLTVEIHGDAESLEECLDQFTAKERLHGDNMYKCDGCNAYVMAWKRLTVQRAPNILTIALKRFQSGRFGKLNKRVTFPETLDLRRYMSELEDENDVYRLYAVIVHIDMLNASFFGHYICYIKDFHGNWFRIDDCKVSTVELEEVLSQGAYMLLYSRVCARPSCLLPADMLRKVETESGSMKADELQPSTNSSDKCLVDSLSHAGQPECDERLLVGCSSESVTNSTEESPFASDPEETKPDNNMVHSEPCSLTGVMDMEIDEPAPVSSSPTEEAAFPLNLAVQKHGIVTSLKTPEAQIPESPSLVTPPINGDIVRKSSEESTSSSNCISEEGNLPHSPHEEAQNHINKADASSSNSSTTEPVKKLTSGSSRPKYKPLFQPGFLGKPPQRRSAIRT